MAQKVSKRLKAKRVIEYAAEQFGYALALTLDKEIEKRVQQLSTLYELYPENKFLPTKTKLYRNVILGKYIILYRIKPTTVEVLAIYHSSIKPARIKKIRSVKP
ncbi:MAG: type II toxin-antitoxin system RelE/ParE family toxin [Bacteroidales bacterium]|jgi:plasmid stabilization system protein ParE|nr:type II toxin-antitoxin system RelE/ParE family toxin [Bacteroidales bacterium]MDD4216343.1 type II toxin-antitoxin system RelE/ParE family toxin [Bacteroidales bacterium]MDY0140499.1 type II toxin-antitoxin system RelE/ParE family toxin [Bacteroidales bacterium]